MVEPTAGFCSLPITWLSFLGGGSEWIAQVETSHGYPCLGDKLAMKPWEGFASGGRVYGQGVEFLGFTGSGVQVFRV